VKKEERIAHLKEMLEAMLSYERALWSDGTELVGGIDEVGRGPLAGPVCAACVVLPHDFDTIGINDSKKLSEKKRDELYTVLVEKAVCYGIGLVSNGRIDEVNILNATKEAMVKAIRSAGSTMSQPIDHILVDAVKLPEAGIPGTAIIKGDEKSVSIAAASIMAKVTRDRMMIEFDTIYPGYGFARNKGYGTEEHMAALRKLGPTPIHRRTFLKGVF